MSNSLDPDRARQNVGPDLVPNCLQRLSADDTSRQRVHVFQINLFQTRGYKTFFMLNSAEHEISIAY